MWGEDDDSKLYIKASCSLCLGGTRGGVFANCPYCDINRQTYVEASFNHIKENLSQNLTSGEKNELISYLKMNEK